MKLVLGFEDYPYGRTTVDRPRLRRAPQSYGRGKSTKEVSQTLEERYNIVETFYNMEEDYIIDLIEDQAAMDLDEIMTMEQPSKKGMSFAETDKVETKFKNNLSRQVYNGMIHGVPTKASLREGRQSFIRTGLYRNSFRAWMEE